MPQTQSIVYFSLGSNLGDRISNLEIGLRGISKLGVDWIMSPIYETEPWGYTDSNRYLNMVVQTKTTLSVSDLMRTIGELERKSGRVSKPAQPSAAYEARRLDIDLLFYGKETITKTNLIIPHPRLHLRNFVLFPLADIAPDFVHPKFGITIAELKSESKDHLEIQRIAQRL